MLKSTRGKSDNALFNIVFASRGMTKAKIKAYGSELDHEVKNISIEDLELDSNNPRIGYYLDSVGQRGEKVTQDQVSMAIKAGAIDDYRSLYDNIESNEGVLFEIWVYPVENNKYKVIDGNTRVVIYRELGKKNPYNKAWKEIPAKVLSTEENQRAVDFIRLTTHLQGINNWQSYERARYIHLLYDSGSDLDELQRRTKLTKNALKRWLKAFSDMEDQFLPNYGEAVNNPLSKFSYFVEYNNQKTVDGMARNGMGIQDFCKWVGDEEVRTAQDVRMLDDMLSDGEIAKTLKERGFAFAYSELSYKKPAHASKLFDQIQSVIKGIKQMPLEDIVTIREDPESAKRVLIFELDIQIQKLKKQIEDS